MPARSSFRICGAAAQLAFVHGFDAIVTCALGIGRNHSNIQRRLATRGRRGEYVSRAERWMGGNEPGDLKRGAGVGRSGERVNRVTKVVVAGCAWPASAEERVCARGPEDAATVGAYDWFVGSS